MSVEVAQHVEIDDAVRIGLALDRVHH